MELEAYNQEVSGQTKHQMVSTKRKSTINEKKAWDITEKIRYLALKGKSLIVTDMVCGYLRPYGVAKCYEMCVIIKEVHYKVSLIWSDPC